jgi:hypothetical protein
VEKSDKLPLTPEQQIRELEQQLVQADEKAQLFEAVIDILKKGSSRKKAFGQAVTQKHIKGLSVARACRYMALVTKCFTNDASAIARVQNGTRNWSHW